VAAIVTVPCTPADRAMSGYSGITSVIRTGSVARDIAFTVVTAVARRAAARRAASASGR
jgi:hypothetical protein